MNLEKLFNPQSIAVVGASPEDGKVGNVIMKNLFAHGYAGKVYLVNPKYDDIFSQPCFKNLHEIKDKIDLAVIAIPAKLVLEEIRKNADQIKNYVVISAGFGETNPEGKKREADLSKLAQEKNLNILGPNCLGFIIPEIKLNASFAGGMPESGSVAFVSQSGALAVAFMDTAKKENTKFSAIISIGNKMQISESEVLEYLEKDPKTKAIGMYLEGIKNGKKFLETAERVSKAKPIIALKAGKNSKTQKAIQSHTGALAGDDEIMSAVMEKAGVIRAKNLEEFSNIFSLMENSAPPQNNQVALITNAGGLGVLAADAFSEKRIKLYEFQEKEKENLRSFLPSESSVENPVDLLGDAKADRYAKTLEVISKISEIGSVLCLLTPQDQTPVLEIAQEIIKFKKNTDKLVLTVFLGGDRVKEAVEKLKKAEISVFDYPDEAVAAIDGYFSWKEFKEAKTKSAEEVINRKRKEKASAIIQKAKEEGRQALYFSESAKIMEMYGIIPAEAVEIEKEEKILSKIKFPAAIKIDSDQALHKTERNGVILNIRNRNDLMTFYDKMKMDFPEAKVIAQPMTSGGIEIILGIKKDPVFGSVAICGLGGIYTEIFRMIDYFIPPLNLSQIKSSLENGKTGFLFRDTRGQKKYGAEELAKVIQGMLIFSAEIPDFSEFDINPLVIYNDGKIPIALDIKLIF